MQIAKTIYSDRPYKIPKGYCPWDEICVMLAMSARAVTEMHDEDAVHEDLASSLHHHRSVLWLAQNAPLYLVENELLRQVEHTDLPTGKNTLLEGLTEPPLRTAMFLLPINAWPAPDGGSVDSIVFHFSDIAQPQHSTGLYRGLKLPHLLHQEDVPVNLHWSAVDSRTTVWFGGSYLNPDGELISSEDENLGADILSDEDRLFTQRTKHLVVQLWLLACFLPSAFEVAEVGGGSTGASITRPNRRAARHWSPRRLVLPAGDRDKAPRRGSGNPHASPHTHWRRGHWRNVAIGEGRTGRKLVWIKPTVINSGVKNGG